MTRKGTKTKIKERVGFVLVGGYIVTFLLLFRSSLPFLEVALIDFFLMLVLMGAFALLFGRETRDKLDSQYFKRKGRLF